MKALKMTVGALLVVAVIIAIAAFILYQNIEGIAKRGIERLGSEVTQSQVRVNNVKLELRRGRGEISGLSITNPQGFSDNNILDLDLIALQLEPASVREDVIVLEEVLVDGAKILMEHRGVTETNIKALLDNTLASLRTDEPREDPEEERLFMVEHLRFTNISMNVVSPYIENRILVLDDIERNNLGTREQGLTGRELALAVTQPIIDEARKRFEAELRGRAGDRLQERLDETLSDEDRSRLDRLRSLRR